MAPAGNPPRRQHAAARRRRGLLTPTAACFVALLALAGHLAAAETPPQPAADPVATPTEVQRATPPDAPASGQAASGQAQSGQAQSGQAAAGEATSSETTPGAASGEPAAPAAAKAQFVAVLRLVPRLHAEAAWTPADQEAVSRHFQRLVEGSAAGSVLLAGRTQEPLDRTFGLIVFEAADEAAARAWAEADPAVAGGVMTVTVHPYAVAVARE